MSDPTYTHGHHPAVLRSHSWRTAANSAPQLLPLLEPGMSVLDVGCGPGTITVDLAVRVPGGSVVGIDAGVGDVTTTTSEWRFSDPRDRSWCSSTWAERVRRSAIATQLVASAMCDPDELESIAAAFGRWADDPSGWFVVPHTEIVGRT